MLWQSKINSFFISLSLSHFSCFYPPLNSFPTLNQSSSFSLKPFVFLALSRYFVAILFLVIRYFTSYVCILSSLWSHVIRVVYLLKIFFQVKLLILLLKILKLIKDFNCGLFHFKSLMFNPLFDWLLMGYFLVLILRLFFKTCMRIISLY